MKGLLDGKRILVTGVATEASIAFATARAAQAQGATVVLTAMRRDLDAARELADRLPVPPASVVALDATSTADLGALAASVGPLDGAVHAIAFASQAALRGIAGVDAADAEVAFRTSVWTYAALADLLAQVAPRTGASLVGLDFDARGAWPVYGWMGVCKAALEAANRALARELGPRGIRTNLVAAGPLATRAATAIPGFEHLLAHWRAGSPLPWDPDDPGVVADTVCWLLSDGSRATTGSVAYVDGGCSAISGVVA